MNEVRTAPAGPDSSTAGATSAAMQVTGTSSFPLGYGHGKIMSFMFLSEDELIARLLIHTWTLTTGKTIRGDVPPHELTEEELIDFWSDDRFD